MFAPHIVYLALGVNITLLSSSHLHASDGTARVAMCNVNP